MKSSDCAAYCVVESLMTASQQLPPHLALPVALAMFTGLRQGDVLSLTKAAIKNGVIWRKTGKTGQSVFLPIHPDLAEVLASAPAHDAITIAANIHGKPWTPDGFRASFAKAMAKLRRSSDVEPGLTFHGLRHTLGTLLREVTDDLDLIRRWLGQKTLAMAMHYSSTADTSKQMLDVVERLDPLGSKPGTKVSNTAEKSV
jgi:integrase